MQPQQDLNKHADPTNFLRKDYQRWKQLFEAQSGLIQRFLEAQARNLADGLEQSTTQVRFSLPDQVFCVDENGNGLSKAFRVPANSREQMAGGLLERLNKTALNVILREKMNELEASANPAISTGAGLIRFAVAYHLVYIQLPDGRTVHYHTIDDEEIPSIPDSDPNQPESAITEATDAIAEDVVETGGEGRQGELQVPYVPAARRFFLPQWVAFDAEDQLLVGTLNEAESYIHSTQRYLHLLHLAVSIASYMVADEQYQRKRYGILGQLVNQGRAMARYETRQIIETIRRRAADHNLNRGLSLSLPFFDDQILELKTYDFQVIPAGRIMFVPAFVVRASRHEQVKVAQDTRLSPSTRNHLGSELEMLENTFSGLAE